ncbi:MAG: lysine--tRNA ligase [Phycisphaerales bacterium]
MTADQTHKTAHADDLHHLELVRREHRDALAASGINPYGQRTDDLIPLAEARARFDQAANDAFNDAVAKAKAAPPNSAPAPASGSGDDPRPRAKVVGRVMLKREGGKLVWMQLRDATTGPARWWEQGEGNEERKDHRSETGATEEEEADTRATGALGRMAPDLQIAVSKGDVGDETFAALKSVDLGDVIIVEGPIMKTNKGEITIWASSWTMGTKSLVPPPEKWSGLQDVEARYRKRYIDLYANPDATHVAVMRSRLIARIRRYLDAQGFHEVDTPVLQIQAGGAAARPFMTHMNALDIDLFLRIAPELFLKRLMVGGMHRVYEISRNFRNEGLSPRHNPEFTSLELYQAFGNYHTMADIMEAMIREAAREVAGARGDANDLKLPYADLTIDYAPAFDRITFADLFQRALGFPMTDATKVRAAAAQHKLKTTGAKGEPLADVLLVNELFEEVAEPTLDPSRPTFVFDYPAALSPLTRPKGDDPTIAERWDLFIGGMEIGPAYTELNDPDIQAAKFREQLAGIDDDESTFRNFDADFIEALKVGMPPAGGLGLGIDRLCMLLLNQKSIRDVILFPMMRPIEND